jgi:tetratricopeptide (TPR) repeat protein
MASLYRWTRESTSEALRLFYKAIALDPDFSPSYGMAAWCYFWRMGSGWTTDRVQEVGEVIRLADSATELGKDDAIALSFSGLALGLVAGEVEGGAALVDRALLLNPNLAAAWIASGFLKVFLGDYDVAIEHEARAMRLSPLDPLMFYMHHVTALALYLAGRYDEAGQMAERALRERPNWLNSLRVAAASHALAGRIEEARRFIGRALHFDPEMRVTNIKDRFGPFRPQDAANYIEALRKAGLPE